MYSLNGVSCLAKSGACGTPRGATELILNDSWIVASTYGILEKKCKFYMHRTLIRICHFYFGLSLKPGNLSRPTTASISACTFFCTSGLHTM